MKNLINAWKDIAVGLRWVFVACMAISLAMIYLKAKPECWEYGQEVGQFMEGLAMAYVTAFIFFILTDVSKEQSLQQNALTIYSGELHDIYIVASQPFNHVINAMVRLHEGALVDGRELSTMNDGEFIALLMRLHEHRDQRQSANASDELLKFNGTQFNEQFDQHLQTLLGHHQNLPDKLVQALTTLRDATSNLKLSSSFLKQLDPATQDERYKAVLFLLIPLVALRMSLVEMAPYVMGPPTLGKLAGPDHAAFIVHVSEVQHEISVFKSDPPLPGTP